MQKITAKTHRSLLIASLILGLIVLFWGLGSLQLMSLNEGRRALVIKEMFAHHNWLLPTLNNELYLTKPPLLYWISVFFSFIIGHVNEWTIRLPSAISALIVVILAYRYTNKHFGRWAGFFVITLLMSNVGFAMLARRAEIEMLLTALCFGSLLSALQYVEDSKKQWIYISYALLGLAVLTKGPVAMLFVTLPLLVTTIWTKHAQLKTILISKTGWLIFVVVALSWYLLVTIQLGPDIWQTIAKRDMLDKMQSGDRAKPLLSYVAWIAVDFLLLVGLFVYKPKALWKEHKDKLAFVIPLVTAVVAVLVFSVFANKHAKYLLPIYPVIAILLSVQIACIFESSGQHLKRLILLLSVILPIIYTVYYVYGEATLYEYRTAVFKPFQEWSAGASTDTLYVLENIDARLVYYSEKPIREITLAKLVKLHNNGQSALVLSQKPLSMALVDCQVNTFEPYLKKHKKLMVYDLGAHCKDFK
jgi:4-amino-4-deoxy-L-arabinose transferase-like glycosyltransferase